MAAYGSSLSSQKTAGIQKYHQIVIYLFIEEIHEIATTEGKFKRGSG